MPDLLELSGLLGDFGRAKYLAALQASKKNTKAASKKPGGFRALPAERQIAIAEKMASDPRPQVRRLAINWANWALENAKKEKNKLVAKRAEDIIKRLRGEAVVAALGGLGDIDGIVMGRMMGLW